MSTSFLYYLLEVRAHSQGIVKVLLLSFCGFARKNDVPFAHCKKHIEKKANNIQIIRQSRASEWDIWDTWNTGKISLNPALVPKPIFGAPINSMLVVFLACDSGISVMVGLREY